ncbi:MAG: hypothetical protein ACI4IN_04060 [Eubacterium sp.]
MKKDYVLTLVLAMVVLCIVVFSGDSRQGAANGLALCENVIVPSLLPVLVLTNTIVLCRGAGLFNTVFGRMFEVLFRLPRNTAVVVLFGLIGGYPAGTILTHQLYDRGDIDSGIARRLMSFNFCGGVAFIVTAVGTICYGSTRIGLMLYGVSVASSFIICVITGLLAPKIEKGDNAAVIGLSFTDALTTAVETTATAIINMCMYIVLFSAIAGLLDIPDWMIPLVEITNGVCGQNTLMPLKFCVAFITFGGFCIHFQLIGMLRDMKVKYMYFLFYRVVGAVLSYCLMMLLQFAMGDSAPVFSTVATVTNGLCRVNMGLSVVLVLGCAVLVLDVESKKSKLLYQTNCDII